MVNKDDNSFNSNDTLDKPKPTTPNENDKQEYEWVDITFVNGTSYESKIFLIKNICATFFIESGDKDTLKLIIKSGNNEVTLSSDIFCRSNYR